MQVSDPVADLLTRVRNASMAGIMYASIPASRLKIDIVKVLEQEGYIRGFRLIRDGKQGMIKVAIKYTIAGQPVIRKLDKVSTPGRRVYANVEQLTKTYSRQIGTAIVSTPRGVMTSREAKVQNVGGEVLAYVW